MAVVAVSDGDGGLDGSWRGCDAARNGRDGLPRVDGTSGLSIGVKGRRGGSVGGVATNTGPIITVVAEPMIMTCRSGTAWDSKVALGWLLSGAWCHRNLDRWRSS